MLKLRLCYVCVSQYKERGEKNKQTSTDGVKNILLLQLRQVVHGYILF